MSDFRVGDLLEQTGEFWISVLVLLRLDKEPFHLLIHPCLVIDWHLLGGLIVIFVQRNRLATRDESKQSWGEESHNILIVKIKVLLNGESIIYLSIKFCQLNSNVNDSS